jgi:hypothetical protein
MAKKIGDDIESRLDWYYISRQGVYRVLAGFVVVAALVVAGVWYVSHRDSGAVARAREEILRAEERLADVRRLKDADRYEEEIGRMSGMIGEAQKLFAVRELERARTQAVTAQQLARNVLSGKTAQRGDANVIEVAGKVELQRANTTAWEPLGRGTALREGDFIKTGASGTAEVMAMNGTLYRIGPETLFEVHRSGSTAEGEKTSGAKAVVGNVELDTGERGRSTLTTEAASIDIAHNSVVSVDTDAVRTGVSTFQGEAKLTTSAGRSVTLGEHERAEASKERGTISEKQRLPDPPSLLEPEDKAVFELGRKEIAIRWSPVKEASVYQVQVARSRLFVPDSLFGSTAECPRTTTAARIPVAETGLYFWRVQAVRRDPKELTSGWSVPRRFKVVPPNTTVERTGVPPDLVVNRPQVIGNTVIVSGKTEPGATVTVAGEPADVDATGVFRKVISVGGEGLRVITIRAVNSAGLETLKKESVLIQD